MDYITAPNTWRCRNGTLLLGTTLLMVAEQQSIEQAAFRLKPIERSVIRVQGFALIGLQGLG